MINENVKEIATRIKELRELSEISTAEMAECIQSTEEYYKSYEAGNEDISASRLYEIATKLHVDLALLLTGKASRMASFTVTRANQGVKVERRKEYIYQSLAANFTNKKVEPFLVTVPVAQDSDKIVQNSHNGQEMNFLLEGQLKVLICGNEIILNPGDSIYYDSTNPHGMAAIGDVPAKFIAILVP